MQYLPKRLLKGSKARKRRISSEYKKWVQLRRFKSYLYRKRAWRPFLRRRYKKNRNFVKFIKRKKKIIKSKKTFMFNKRLFAYSLRKIISYRGVKTYKKEEYTFLKKARRSLLVFLRWFKRFITFYIKKSVRRLKRKLGLGVIGKEFFINISNS